MVITANTCVNSGLTTGGEYREVCWMGEAE